MRKHILLAGLLASGLALPACTTAQVGTGLVDGQLVCAVGLTSAAMFATSGEAILAKGALASAVSDVCGLIHGIAVSPPGTPLPSVTVALPPGITIPLAS